METHIQHFEIQGLTCQSCVKTLTDTFTLVSWHASV
jgi:hypothetical protein